MEMPAVPQDDLLDVMEMTQKLEGHINHIFKNNETSLGMSALMSAMINGVISQSETLEEVVFYRNLFIQFFDSSIRNIKLKGK